MLPKFTGGWQWSKKIIGSYHKKQKSLLIFSYDCVIFLVSLEDKTK